jgi:uncharacterized protein (TIGR03086 family)
MIDSIDAHDRALDAATAIIANIDRDQLDLPTPCDDFDVRALLGHLVAGNRRFLAVAHGEPAISVPLDVDAADDQWLVAYRDSAAAVAAAWHDQALLEEPAVLPFGEVPGAVALGIHTVEAIVHGWDLAIATGQPATIEPELCEVAWHNAQLVDDNLRGPGRAFGAAVPVPDSATPTERLVAWLGRRP